MSLTPEKQRRSAHDQKDGGPSANPNGIILPIAPPSVTLNLNSPRDKGHGSQMASLNASEKLCRNSFFPSR